MSVLKYIIIFFIIFESVSCNRLLGAPCFKKNITGICRRILSCVYAVTEVEQEQRKPVICGYDDDGTEIACCPTQNLMHHTGQFQKYFKATQEGVIASNNITCRYKGKQPFLCCKKEPEIPDPPEPVQCEPQADPSPAPKILNPMEQFLWDKCLSYRRYVNKCVNDENDPGVFTRQNTCGIPKTKDVFRIFGGEPALPRQFPHMAVLGVADKENEADIFWLAGGSLISEHFILTAAHVLITPSYGRIYYALLGSLNKKSKESVLVNVISTIQHKLYETFAKKYDIALLRLQERVQFNEFIRPICLPISDRKIGEERYVAGWGLKNDKETSDELLYVDVKERDYRLSCQRVYVDGYDPETMICAHGTKEILKDSCKSDSGGPLMAQLTNVICSYSVEGIVSFGAEKCGGNLGVYTRVSSYLDWIVQRVWPEEWEKFHK